MLRQHTVDAAGLLLLAKLEQVLAVLAAAPAVLARRVRPNLDRALRGLALAALEEQLHLLAPAHAAVGSGVTGHVSLPLQSRRWPVRPGGASWGGSRCAAGG